MATSKEFKDYAVEQLSALGDIMCRPMMGEFLLYYRGVLFGGLYDGRVIVSSAKEIYGEGYKAHDDEEL